MSLFRPCHQRTAVVVTGAVALLLVSCSGGGEPAAAEDNDLVVAGQFPIESIDPLGPLAIDAGTALAARQLYSPLVRTLGDGGEFEGVVASDWEIDDDSTAVTFTLQDGLTFSDGSALDADDVVASFDRVTGADTPFSANFAGVDVAADGADVTFTPEGPDPALLGKLTSFMVTPSDAGEDSYADQPVTSGAFMVESFSPGGELAMIPNPEYWGEATGLDRLVIRSIPEVSARTAALQTGEIDITWGVPDDQLGPLEQSDTVTLSSAPGSQVMTMWMNSSTPSLQSAEVRRALWQAVDFETMITSLYPQSGSPADSVVAPTVFGYTPQPGVEHDPEAARQALVDAGFDFDTPLRFQYSQPQLTQWVEAVVADLDAVGVTVEALQKEQAVFVEDLVALNWDINIQILGTLGLDSATNLGRLYTCAADRMGYCNEDLDASLLEAGTTVDPAVREAAYADAIETIWGDAVGMYPMFVTVVYASRNEVSGFEPDGEGFPYFAGVSTTS